MPEKIHFTKAAIDALPTQEGRSWVADAGTRHLQLCIQPTGLRALYWRGQIRGKATQVKIGDYPGTTITQARTRAAELTAASGRGEDPRESPMAPEEELTFGGLFAWYMETHAKPRKKTWANDEALHHRHLRALDPLPLSGVTRTRIRELHAQVGKGTPIEANRLLALIRCVFSRAIAAERWVGTNPGEGVDAFRERPRKRRLSVEELGRLLSTLAEDPSRDLRDLVLLLLYTGARLSTVLAMRWEDVDLRAGVWEIPETKNGEPLTVPLEAAELEILGGRLALRETSPWVFPSARAKGGHMIQPHPAWWKLLERADLPGLRLHDLRRSLASLMIDVPGVKMETIGAALGHQSPQTTARVYAHLSARPVREAKRAAHAVIAAAGAGAPS